MPSKKTKRVFRAGPQTSSQHLAAPKDLLEAGKAQKEGEQTLREQVAHLRKQLRENDRLVAIGREAAKLVHELGNPLNGISGTIQMLQRQLAEQRDLVNDPVYESVQDLQAGITRFAALLQEFRTYSREQHLLFQATNLPALVREVLSAETPAYVQQGVKVKQILAPDIPPVLADGDKFRQVLLNLCKNAVEAMPQGGALTVQLQWVEEKVRLTVADTGAGIPTGVNILEPFVSTKARGMGLGLPIVRQIIEAHQGTLTYTSEAGKGATFIVNLPLASCDQAPLESVSPEWVGTPTSEPHRIDTERLGRMIKAMSEKERRE
ncbi:MAG: PAS domain-containing sensor histidine kinase [Candidatus Binatia bacterium]